MSNPSINRWGLNLIWYKLWYTDKLKQTFIQQDHSFEKLIYFYIYYGFKHTFNIFKHTFWYHHALFPKNEHNSFNAQYERECDFEDKFTKETIRVNLRNKTQDFFNSKLWILRFQKWILFNFFTFQPIKKKLNKKIFIKKNLSTLSTKMIYPDTNLLKRIKLLFLYSLYCQNFSYYKF